MNEYYKTQLGIDTLQSRSKDLTARQRRLLVLIGTEDFTLLADQFKQRIAPPELLEQLSNLGLISTPHLDQMSHLSEIQVKLEAVTQPPNQLQNPLETAVTLSSTSAVMPKINPSESSIQLVQKQEPNSQNFDDLTIHQIQALMIELLEQYCGLMAKPLILEIKKSSNLASLKMCQIQWITHLQESRIAPALLNQNLQQINYSIHHLMHS